MTVSVTGATGFIGRRLVQRLHAGKTSVWSICNPTSICNFRCIDIGWLCCFFFINSFFACPQ